MNPSRAWQFLSAAAALLLTVGYLLLSLSLIALVVYWPYRALPEPRHLSPYLVFGSLSVAVLIIINILPSWDHFSPPGPQLTAERQPRLFDLLRRSAEAVGQPMPDAVYLASDVNPYVAQRGGMLGWRSTRVMAVGLPLLQTLSVSELQAILAHGFGHFAPSDTALRSWISRLRAAMWQRVTASGCVQFWAHVPFQIYGYLFLRMTQGIAHSQEFAIDAQAARIAGPQALASALRKIHFGAMAVGVYYINDLIPLLMHGFRPPQAEGFGIFLRSSGAVERSELAYHAAMKDEVGDDIDSHPPLGQRIAALERLNAPPLPDDPRPAVELLDDLDGLESELVGFMGSYNPRGHGLRRVAWADVVDRFHIPHFRRLVRREAAVVAGLTVADLMDLADDLEAAFHRLSYRAGMPSPLDRPGTNRQLRDVAEVAGAALALMLLEDGWELDTAPGEPLRARKAEHEILPLTILPALYDGSLTAKAWQARCEATGIGGLTLL